VQIQVTCECTRGQLYLQCSTSPAASNASPFLLSQMHHLSIASNNASSPIASNASPAHCLKCITCPLPPVHHLTCRLQCITCHLKCITCPLPSMHCLTCHLQCITLPIVSNASPICPYASSPPSLSLCITCSSSPIHYPRMHHLPVVSNASPACGLKCVTFQPCSLYWL
jgi:hypothetical protein